jgi:glyoxylase-like metal-dependent hydrolase (beta-lactamase superfamily II)
LPVEYIPGQPGRPGFDWFFGGWLAECRGQAVLVDCGVGGGAEDLARRLKARLGERDLDYVLLTHIHLDHAGALGEIFRAWPRARAVVHEKGLRHLADPERLWAGTREVMGELADMYGRPEPVDPGRLISHREADLPGLRIWETPGHAAHHLAFRLEETWFPGEAGGCPHVWEGRGHNRPATPSRFNLPLALASIERLLAEPDGPACFPHLAGQRPLREILLLGRRQLAFWIERLSGPDAARRPGESPSERLDRLAERLWREDPELAPLHPLPPAELRRERFFLRNNLAGLLECLETAENAAEGGAGG